MLDVTFFTISFRLQRYVGSVIRAIFFMIIRNGSKARNDDSSYRKNR